MADVSELSPPPSRSPSASPTPRIYTVGRLALWLVLALMLGSVAYAAWQAIANWSAITV